MQRCAAYYRVSTANQRENQTIESQKSRASVDIATRGLLLVREYDDDGETASSLHNRTGMLNLLADAEMGLFEAVWVMDLDRFDRSSSSIEWSIIKETFRKHGITVITPSQVIDFRNEDQEFMADILNRVAALELRKICARMLNGKWAKVREGRWVGGTVPFGYFVDEDNKYQIDPTESEAYLDMVRWVEEGASIRTVADRLTNMGIRTPRGGKVWSFSTVSSILRNSLYTGDYHRWHTHYGKGKRNKRKPDEMHITHTLPVLLPPERWERLQDLMASRKVMSPRSLKLEYLLSKLVHCVHCNCLMTGECRTSGRATPQRVYACAAHRRGVSHCPAPYLVAPPLEAAVCTAIAPHLRNLAHLQSQVEESLNVKPSKAVSHLINQLSTKEREEQRLVDLYTADIIDKPELTRRIKLMREQKRALQENIDAVKRQWRVQDKLASFQQMVQFLSSQTGSFDQWPFAAKRKVLEWWFLGREGQGIYYFPDTKHLELRGTVPLPPLKL